MSSPPNSDKPSATSNKPAATSDKSAATSDKPAATSDKPAATHNKPGATSKQPAAASDKPAATPHKSATTSDKPAATHNKPGATSKQPAAASDKPAATPHKSATTSDKPAVASKKPAAASNKPGATPNQPAVPPNGPGTPAKKHQIDKLPPPTPPPSPSSSPSSSTYNSTNASMIVNVPDSIKSPSKITYIEPSSLDARPSTSNAGSKPPVPPNPLNYASIATEQPRPSTSFSILPDESELDDADESGWKSLPPKLMLAIIAAGVGTAFQHGYNTGVTNVPTDLIIKFINETSRKRKPNTDVSEESLNVTFSAIVSFFAIGGMFGALATGYVADKIGRKTGLLANNILVLIAACLMGFSKTASSYEMLMVGRFIIGVNAGLNAGLGPMYLSEISPVHFRGAIGTIYQLIITISILASNVLGSASFLGTESLWPVLLATTLFGSLVMLALLPMCPESPNYLLIIKENDNQAQNALIWLRGTTDVHDEMEEMKRQADEMKKVQKVTLKQMWTNPLLRKPLIISLVIMMGQQLSGINAVMFYSSSIFQDAGLDSSGAYVAVLVMGVINVAMTFVSLVLIDRAGRKILLIAGFGGMAITTVIFVVCLNLNKIIFFKYLGVIAVFLFVVMFATGPGSIPWFLVSELFAVDARGIASSLAVAINWGANYVVGLTFLPINLALGSQTFLIFTVILSFMVFYTKRYVPETKGRTIEEIQAEFRQNS